MSGTRIPALVALVNFATFHAGDIIAVDPATIASISAAYSTRDYARTLVPYGTLAVGGASSTGSVAPTVSGGSGTSTGTTSTVTGGTGTTGGGTSTSTAVLTVRDTNEVGPNLVVTFTDGSTRTLPLNTMTAAQASALLSLPTLTTAEAADASGLTAETTRAKAAEAALSSTLAARLTGDEATLSATGSVTGAQTAAISALNSAFGSLTAGEAALAAKVATPTSAVLLGTDSTGRFVGHMPDSNFFSLTAGGILTINPSGFSGASSTGTAGSGTTSPAATVPGQVTGLTVGSTAPTYAPLSWTAPASGGTPTGYTISYGTAGGPVTTIMTGSTSTSYTLTGLVAGTTYVVSVQATNSAGSGTASSNASATTAAAPSASTLPPPMPALGTAPSASGTPPTIYQVVTAQCTGPTSLTATLAALTAGSNVAVLVNGGSGAQNAANATVSATGLTKLTDAVFQNGWVLEMFGPSSALGGTTFTLSNIVDTVNMMIVETNAQGADFTHGALSGVGTTTRTWTPTAADTASAASVVLAKTNENGLMTVVGENAIGSFPGNSTTPPYNAAVAFSPAAGASAPVNMGTANANTSPSSSTCAVTVNLYAHPLAGGVTAAATPVVIGGAIPTPAVIPPPAGGYAPYHQRDLAAVAQGKQPRFTLGMFGASYTQGFRRLALATTAIGFAQARLDFASYASMSDTYGSTQYRGRKNAAQGVTDKMLCISFVPWSSTSFIGDVAAGNYDSFYQGLADDLIANGSARVRLRITWELNQQYYYTVDIHNCRDQFVAAIRRVVWLMTSRPGAQFTIDGPAPILVAGSDANGDPTNYLTGVDATGDLSSDGYITAYLDNQGPLTAATPARIASLKAAYFDANTGSTSWQARYARQYGVPMGFGEGACGGTRRNDAYGIGDVPELMTAYADECLITDPVAYLFQWLDNGGGTDSWVTPMGYWPNSSNFPATYEVYKARFGTPQADPDVANGAIPQAPGLTASFSNGVLTLATTKASGDTVNYTVKQVAIPGTHLWSTWNDVLAADTVASNGMDDDVDHNPPLPLGFVAGGLLDCRVLHSNTLGNSPWTQVRINTATGAQVGSAVNYPSTFGLNEDGTCGPTLVANELPPTGTIGSGSASTAAVSVQKGTAVFPYGATSETVTLPKAATAGNHVVLCYIGYNGNLGDLVAPAGFTPIVSRSLGISQGGALWFGPVSALVNNGVTLSGAATTDQGLLILEETTGGFIEFAGQNGSYGRDSFSVNGSMTASQGGGAQSMAMAWDTAGAAVSTSVGTIDFTVSGINYGGWVYHSLVSLTLPSGTHGPVNVGTVYNSGGPRTPEKPGYLCWTTYISAPPVAAQPTMAQFCAAAGVTPSVPYGSSAASSGGTTTSTASGSPVSTPPVASSTTSVHGAQNYAKVQMTGPGGNITLTLPQTATAGNSVLLMWGASAQPTMPAGWTQLAGQIVPQGYATSAWRAPVSALTNNGLTIPGDFGGAYLIEDSSASFDAATTVPPGANNYITADAPPLASGKTVAQRYGLICAYRGQVDTIGVDKLCTLIDQTAGGDNVGNAFTALFALDPAGATYSFYDQKQTINANPSVVGVNGYLS